ncbi:restriction endonuclease subunit S [Teredinibacter franksiae]|uniref:restriction endonuclease subunit S n=1 Tax=Teredinibacter franksiae TaxID=2761453 RepID=UPI001FE7CD9C|nr:restriction endonuclease subunit S [Teredinibacter franksiae]
MVWPIRTLEYICTSIFAGGDVPKGNYSKFKTDKYFIPIFSNGEKNKGLYGFTDKARVVQPSMTVSARGTIGYSEVRYEPFFPVVRLIVLTPNPDFVELNYLKYILRGMDFVNSGSSIPQLTVPMIKDYQCALPPIHEQKRIVTILDQAFADIEKARANAEQNLKNARELFESYLQQVFSQRGEGWVESELFDHVKFIDYRGKTPKKTESGLRLITAKNVRMGYLRKAPEEYVAPESYDAWMTRGIPQKGDVLFTSEAPLANVAQLDTDEKVVFAQRLITMQPDRSILNEDFLKYLLMSPPIQKRILEKGTGATVTGIKASLLKKIPIEYPSSLKEQRKHVANLNRLDSYVKQLENVYFNKLKALDELKKSILQKAFSGELTKNKTSEENAA